ncbi:MAG: hypothetical protein LUQ07_07715, partial [Methanospirillum sp.]|nr:hypothetical protein [Methanospirillum sp.]
MSLFLSLPCKPEDMDVEGYARRNLLAGRPEEDVAEELATRIQEIKGISRDYALQFAKAVLVEVRATSGLTGDL